MREFLGRFWARITTLFERLLERVSPRLFRREIAPGRFESGTATAWRGFVTTAPMVRPERDYVVYVPRGWVRWRRAPLLVLCHGCRQTPEEFAGATRIAEHADREGWLVLMPRQTKLANAWGCWNWFETNTVHGSGEAAIVAAQIVAVRRAYRVERKRVWVAGLSAGGALAAALGLRYPRLVRGVLVHSGLACGAAATPATVLSVMAHGPDNDVTRIADEARAAQRATAQPVALLAVQGDRDDVVAPANAVGVVDQYLRFNAHPAARSGLPPESLPASDASSLEAPDDRYATRTHDWKQGERVVVRHVAVVGLGHAWSGGDPHFEYADAQGPDALELLVRFAGVAAS